MTRHPLVVDLPLGLGDKELAHRRTGARPEVPSRDGVLPRRVRR